MTQLVLFYIFAGLLLVGAFAVISVRNPVHAAMFLVFTFFQSALLWILIQAEFLGIVLVLVYVGAVMVLFLFVVMMLNVNSAVSREGWVGYAPLGLIIAAVFLGELVLLFQAAEVTDAAFAASTSTIESNTEALGALLYTEYLYPFEIASLILLVAIIAAIILTHRKRPGLKVQNISKQVSVSAKDRVELVDLRKNDA